MGAEITAPDARYENSLRSLVTQQGVTDCVRFYGRVPRENVPSLCAQFEMLVVPSIWQEPFGRVRRGLGNNAKDGTEGARRGNAIGTYLHGSLLPKNPAVTDFLIRRALERREGRAVDLEPLEDTAERAAHARAIALAMRKR